MREWRATRGQAPQPWYRRGALRRSRPHLISSVHVAAMSKKKKLLIVSCCAPCFGAMRLAPEIFEKWDAHVLFLNPNIYPESEHHKRAEEHRKYCATLGLPFHEIPYDHAGWLGAIRGLEDAPERGARCAKCFAYRLKEAARFAVLNRFDAMATVFGVSKFKDQKQVDAAARVVCKIHDVEYINPFTPTFQIRNRKKLDDAINAESEANGLYRQKYCGCEFSN